MLGSSFKEENVMGDAMVEASGDDNVDKTEVTLKTGKWTTTAEGDDAWKELEFADKYVGDSRF